jgi:hypothetical protein
MTKGMTHKQVGQKSEGSKATSDVENLQPNSHGLPEVTRDNIHPMIFEDLISADNTVTLMKPSEIVVPSEYLHPEVEVMPLVASMRRTGLLVALIVAEDNELVSGAKRYQAAVILKFPFVPVRRIKLTGAERILVRIIENENRSAILPLEKIDNASRAKSIYESEHPATKRGGAPGVAGGGKQPVGELSFAKFYAPLVGCSVKTITERIRVGKALSSSIRDLIRQTKVASSLIELKLLASLPHDQQMVSIEAVLEGRFSNIKAWLDDRRKQGRAPSETSKSLAAPVVMTTESESTLDSPDHTVGVGDVPMIAGNSSRGQVDDIVSSPVAAPDAEESFHDAVSVHQARGVGAGDEKSSPEAPTPVERAGEETSEGGREPQPSSLDSLRLDIEKAKALMSNCLLRLMKIATGDSNGVLLASDAARKVAAAMDATTAYFNYVSGGRPINTLQPAP